MLLHHKSYAGLEWNQGENYELLSKIFSASDNFVFNIKQWISHKNKTNIPGHLSRKQFEQTLKLDKKLDWVGKKVGQRKRKREWEGLIKVTKVR